MREYELNLYVDRLTWLAVKDYMSWACGAGDVRLRDVMGFCEDNELDFGEIAILGDMALKYTYQYEM